MAKESLNRLPVKILCGQCDALFKQGNLFQLYFPFDANSEFLKNELSTL